jgi:hypothetical protein
MATQPVFPMAVRPMDDLPEPLPIDLQNKLKAPLPDEAVKPHPKIEGLSSINAAFVIDRMNEVFGIGAYQEHYEKVDISSKEEVWGKGGANERKIKLHVATVHGRLTIPRYGVHLENFGGSDNQDLGDALKGACTDCFTKMCSHLGIGLGVYMSGRGGEAREATRPDCPACGKKLFFSKKAEDPQPYYCWTKKEGCGATFSQEGLKAAQGSKNGQPAAKPPQNTQQVRQPQPAPANDGSKITIAAQVKDKKLKEGRLWLQVGARTCVTMQPEIMNKLVKANKDSQVELMVSPLSSSNGGATIYQVHKVISVHGGAL